MGVIICVLCACRVTSFAQENATTEVIQSQMDVRPEEQVATAIDDEDDSQYLNGMVAVGRIPADSLHLPTLWPGGQMPDAGNWSNWGMYPTMASPWGWQLHEGLNASLDLSVFASFGRGHFSGTSERISAMYAKALTKNLSLAVGGYFQNMNSGIGSMRNAGLSAVLGYRFNDHWKAYVFAQKSLTSSARYAGSVSRLAPAGPGALWQYDMFGHTYGDCIGAGIQYNFNESTWIEVQLDWTWLPNDFHGNIVNKNQMPDQTQTGGNRHAESQNLIPANLKYGQVPHRSAWHDRLCS